ncbi:response regulator [Paenibacillus aurantiacus]|uniref:histidine kinase n=1 Tax=Paenibacillus aurantiacus TaxID=1936118 RepID=A0ABV5KKW7_9BACL
MSHVSIRTKFLVFVILITLLPLVLVGMSNYATAKATIKEALIEKAYAKVRSSADSLSVWLDERRAEVMAISRSEIVRFGSETERLAYLHIETSRKDSPYFSLSYTDGQGYTHFPSGTQAGPNWRPWAKSTSIGYSSITDPFVGPRTGERLFMIRLPVPGQDNEPAGYLNAAIRMDTLAENFLDFRVGLRDIVLLYNREGSILYYPDISKELVYNVRSPELPFASAADSMLGGDHGYTETDSALGRTMVFHADVAQTGWHIGMQVAMKEFEEPLTPLIWRMVLRIAAAEIVMALLLWLYINRLLDRLQRVTDVTEAASAGQFDVIPVPETGRDEITRLSHSVNEMTVHLREMFDQLEAIINQNQYSFIVVDQDYRITYFSKAAERMLGYSAEEVIGVHTPLLFIAPESLAEAASLLSANLGRPVAPDISVLREHRLDNKNYEREWVLVHKDGTRIPVSHSSSAITDREGKVVGVVGISRDITKQKQEEKTRSRQLAVLEAAHDLIATFDADYRLIYLNPAGRAMLGLDMSGEAPLAEEVPERFVETLLLGIDHAIAHGFTENMAELQSPDGRIVNVSKILVAHQDEGTGERFFSCIARDVTETTRVNEMLAEAKREADEASSAKTLFLARMSHEIRTPLAGIIGLTRLMQKTELTQLQRDYADKMQASSEALLRIINDILDFSKVEAGKIELNAVSFNLEEMLQKLADILSVFVGGKEQFEFLMETPERLPAALIGDPLRIEQVLLNLCGNAVKFTNRGHVKLHVQLLVFEPGEDVVVRFSVEDTGIGIAEDQQARLFESFSQAGSSTQRKYGGTGLGLVIAKSLVEMMGGAISYESEAGVGSRFEFTLQFAAQSDAMNEPYHLDENAIWVVEDYPLMAQHWSGMLEDMGLLPIPHGSWRSAQERLARAGIGALPAAVLLDFEMPDMFGDDTWQSFHETALATGVRTIALTTAFGREELLKLPQEERPDAILVKPVTRMALYQTLVPVLGKVSEGTAALAEASAAEEQNFPRRGTILLAEDNAINQLVAAEQLSEWGFTVEVAETGLEVLQMLDSGETYDLILMDIHMPEMDGDEAASIIRSEARFDKLPIIALTANVIKEDHERYYKIGMNDVLTKPIQAEKMRQTVLKWLHAGEEGHVAAALSAAAAESPLHASDEGIALLSVPGMDMVSALARVGGKREILRHMLHVFAAESAQFGDRLRQALLASDYQTARRLAHTLKGSAGNLSAAELAAMADQLESLLKQPIERIDVQAINSAAACVQLVLRPMLKALAGDDK